MDPVSYLFAAYLNAVQKEVYYSLTENLGTQVTAVVVEYDGTEIPFQHQLWTVRRQSVCATTAGNIALHSECTIKAGKMFQEVCQSLNAKPIRDQKYTNARNMYCNAAINFKPVIAQVAPSTEKSDRSLARSACNAATIAAMGSGDAKAVRERDEVCGKYRELRGN